MLRLLFVTFFISHFSFAMIKEEVWGLNSKRRIIIIDTVPTSYKPILRHVIQNNVIISLLSTKATEYTRIRKHDTEIFSARFLEDNTPWNAYAAEKSFYELLAKYQLEDKTSEQIIADCNLSGTVAK